MTGRPVTGCHLPLLSFASLSADFCWRTSPEARASQADKDADFRAEVFAGTVREGAGVTAAAAAQPPPGDPMETQHLLEGPKNDVDKAIKGSLLRTGAGALNYIPLLRATVANSSEAEGFVVSLGVRREGRKGQRAEDS